MNMTVGGKSNLFTINGDGELTALRLTEVGNSISGDLTAIGGDSDAIKLNYGNVETAFGGVSLNEIGSTTATLTYKGNYFALTGLSNGDAIGLNGYNISFEAFGASAAVNFLAATGALSGIKAADGTTFVTEGVSSAVAVIVNGDSIVSDQDFTYTYTSSENILIAIEADAVQLSKTGDATRVQITGTSATIGSQVFLNMEFGSESSGFLVNADSVTAVVMNDGDSFTTNNETATGIRISGASMPTLSNLANSVTFSRSGSGINDAEIAIQGFSSGSIIDGNNGNVAITSYGSHSAGSDEELSLAFKASTGVISRIDGTTNGDVIKVTNATASIAFEAVSYTKILRTTQLLNF